MTYTQTVYDDFSGGSFSTTNWSTPDGMTGIVQASGVLTVTPNSGYPEIRSKTFKDATAGIWAFQLSFSGTTGTGNEFYYGLTDSSGNNAILFQMNPGTTFQQWSVDGAATVSSPVVNVNTGISAWTNGDWLGMAVSGTTITAYKSHDGQTWTELGHATIGGTFAKTAVSIDIVAGLYSGTWTWKPVYDNVSFFTPSSGVAGKVRKGGAWVTPSAVQVRKAGAWVTPSAVKVRKAGAWVTPT